MGTPACTRSEDPVVAHEVETRRRHQGNELLEELLGLRHLVVAGQLAVDLEEGRRLLDEQQVSLASTKTGVGWPLWHRDLVGNIHDSTAVGSCREPLRRVPPVQVGSGAERRVGAEHGSAADDGRDDLEGADLVRRRVQDVS